MFKVMKQRSPTPMKEERHAVPPLHAPKADSPVSE